MSYRIMLIAKNIIALKKNENHNQPMAFTGRRTGRKQASNTVRTNQPARYVVSQQGLFITR